MADVGPPAAGVVNARCLAAWSAAALLVPLISTNPVYRALAALVALDVVVSLSRTGVRLRPLLIALGISGAIAVAAEAFLSHSGDHVILTVPGAVPAFGGPVTWEAALYGLDIAAGLVAGVLAVAPLARSLDAHQLVDALPRHLHRTAVAAGAALAMVPGVTRSASSIRDAQRMRGWEPRGPRSWVDFLVPLTVTAMEDSLTLAEAMEARGYGSGPRTRYRPARPSRADLLVLATALAAAAIVVWARVAGVDDDWFPAPSPTLPPVHLAPVAACALLLTPVLAWRRPTSAD